MKTENKKTDIEIIDGFNCIPFVKDVTISTDVILVNLSTSCTKLDRKGLELILKGAGDRDFGMDLSRRNILIKRDKTCCHKPHPAPDPDPCPEPGPGEPGEVVL